MSSWVSCQKIVFNLHRSYNDIGQLNLTNFNYSSDMFAPEVIQLADEIAKMKPDVLVFMDHKPHPINLLKTVLSKVDYRPRIIFHVFGDFTLYYPQWEKLGKMLTGCPVDFLVASERQKDLIDKFLPRGMSSVVCPFPVNEHDFHFDPSLRLDQRKDWGLGSNEVAYVFTGRLSRQKRIHSLIKLFHQFAKENPKGHLFLYGAPDNVGDQFLGVWETEGEYFRKINRLYKRLPLDIQSRIHFMGSVPNSDLKSVYQGADCLINLSVHNDEDYGMSVAEAQCSGLFSILTDWGGLAGFEHGTLPEATFFIPVMIGIKNKLIDRKKTLQGLQRFSSPVDIRNREKLSRLALEKFGNKRISGILREVIKNSPPPFAGFSPLFQKAVSKTSFEGTPYLTTDRKINRLYREIYSSYVRNT